VLVRGTFQFGSSLLHIPESHNHPRIESNRVLRLTTKAGKTCYPGFQLDELGRVLPGLRVVLGVLASRARSPWTTASWLTSPQPELDGNTPVEFLEAGGDPEQVAQVAGRIATRLDE